MKLMDQKGFSLVELMMVVAIVVIAAAVALPYLTRYTQNNNLRNAARAISGDFFEYKSRAIAEYKRYRITFDTANDNYTIEQCTATGATCAAYSTVDTKAMSGFGTGIDITAAGFGGNPTINFQTRGTTEAGSVTVQNSRGSTATITTNITGKTYVQYVIQ